MTERKKPDEKRSSERGSIDRKGSLRDMKVGKLDSSGEVKRTTKVTKDIRYKRKNTPEVEVAPRPVSFESLDLGVQFDGIGLVKSSVLISTLHPVQPWLATIHEGMEFVLWDYDRSEVVIQKNLSTFANSNVLGDKVKAMALYFVDHFVQSFQNLSSSSGSPMTSSYVIMVTESKTLLLDYGYSSIEVVPIELETKVFDVSHSLQVTICAAQLVSLHGPTLALACSDGTIRFWNFVSNRLCRVIGTTVKQISCFAICSSKLVVATVDGTIHVFDYVEAEGALNLSLSFGLAAHEGPILQLCYDSVTQQVTSSGGDGKTIVWNLFDEGGPRRRLLLDSTCSSLNKLWHPRFPDSSFVITKPGFSKIVVVGTDFKAEAILDLAVFDKKAVLVDSFVSTNWDLIVAVTSNGPVFFKIPLQLPSQCADPEKGLAYFEKDGFLWSLPLTHRREKLVPTKLRELPIASSSVRIDLSPSGRYISLFWNDAQDFKIFQCDTWTILDGGKTNAFSWVGRRQYGSRTDEWYVYLEADTEKANVLPSRTSSSLMDALDCKQSVKTKKLTVDKGQHIATVHSVVATRPILALFAGPMLGIAYESSGTNAFGVSTGSFQFFQHPSMSSRGREFAPPIDVQWNDAGTYAILLYPTQFLLVDDSVQVLKTFTVSAQSFLWSLDGTTLVYSTATAIRCLSLVDVRNIAHFTLTDQSLTRSYPRPIGPLGLLSIQRAHILLMLSDHRPVALPMNEGHLPVTFPVLSNRKISNLKRALDSIEKGQYFEISRFIENSGYVAQARQVIEKLCNEPWILRNPSLLYEEIETCILVGAFNSAITALDSLPQSLLTSQQVLDLLLKLGRAAELEIDIGKVKLATKAFTQAALREPRLHKQAKRREDFSQFLTLSCYRDLGLHFNKTHQILELKALSTKVQNSYLY